MKLASIALIIISFLATFVDSVLCVNHDVSKSENIISLVSAADSNSQNNQMDFSPFDHCEICPDSCNANLTVIVNSYKEIFDSSPLMAKITFTYIGLKLNTFLSQSERPPTLV